jgi:glucose/arabinose dehydrogenase
MRLELRPPWPLTSPQAVVALLAGLALLATACRPGEAPAPQRPGAQPARPAEAQSGAPARSEPSRRVQQTSASIPVPLQVPEQFRRGVLAQPRTIMLPSGFQIGVFAAGLGSPRSMTISPEGVIYVTIPTEGRIVALTDADGDGVAERVENAATGLQCPYGMAFLEGYLYVAQTTRIVRYQYTPGQVRLGSGEVVVSGLPQTGCGPHHFRPLVIDWSHTIFTAVGSTCNVCVERDPRHGTVLRFGLDGQGGIFATGLRNAVGLTIDPNTGQVWAVVNERDYLGDDIPEDMVTIVYEGADYGWPYCYLANGQWQRDTRVPPRPGGCEGLTSPTVGIQAHSAPLGLTFYLAEQFPPEFRGSLFVGLHGSWNRSEGTGFKVIRIPFVDGQPQPPEDFATGWLTGPRGPNDAWGRPVEPLVAKDGSLLVSDDRAGAIYRIWYAGEVATAKR